MILICIADVGALFSVVFLGQPIERKPRKFNPLVIPKTLQAALPFASKPKDIPTRKQPLLEKRRAVVMEPHERRVHALVQHLQLIRHEKVQYAIRHVQWHCKWT